VLSAGAEGLRAVAQPCSLTVLVPVVFAAIAARGRWAAVGGALLAGVFGGWVYVAGWYQPGDGAEQLSGVVMLAGLVGLVVATWRELAVPPAATAAIAAGVTLIATTWWRPCVGPELGAMLTRAPGNPWSQLLPTAAFMTGMLVPVLVVGLLATLWPLPTRVAGPVTAGGAVVAGVLAGAVALGHRDAVVSELVRLTLG